MPSCQLIYDIPARVENTTLERKEQKKLGPLERNKARSSAKTQE